MFFFFKQKTAYEMRISDWSSDVCSSDLHAIAHSSMAEINDSPALKTMHNGAYDCSYFIRDLCPPRNYLYDSMLMWYSRFSELPKTLDFVSSILLDDYQYWKDDIKGTRSEEHTSELQSLMRISYAVFCLKKNTNNN